VHVPQGGFEGRRRQTHHKPEKRPLPPANTDVEPLQVYNTGIKSVVVSTPTKPASCDVITDGTVPGYQTENINSILGHNAERVYVINHGGGELYVVYSPMGDRFSSEETYIIEGGIAIFENVYEIRLRSPILGSQYQVTEHEIPVFKINVVKAEKIEIISTDKDHFRLEIVMNAHEEENITGLYTNKYFIRGVNIQSKQPLKFRLIFWGSDTFDDVSDIDKDTYIDDVELDMTAYPAFRINNADQYRLNVGALDILYEDYDATRELHISLQNLSATSKIAGGAGEVQLDIKMSPRL